MKALYVLVLAFVLVAAAHSQSPLASKPLKPVGEEAYHMLLEFLN